MKINEIIEHYGNRLKAAAEIGVSITTIDNWVNNDKVPRLSQLAIQTLTKNKLKSD